MRDTINWGIFKRHFWGELLRHQQLGVRHVETAVLALPFVEGRAADPIFAANIGGLRASFLLAQNPDDLLFREPARLHVHPP